MPESARKTASTHWWLRLRRCLGRAVSALAIFWLVYGCFLLLGFIPVNRGYRVPPAEDRVRIFIRSSDIHTDFVLPISTPEADWGELFPARQFRAPLGNAKYVAIGWGSRSFYVETPTWGDLKISTLFTTLFTPSESVLHAEYLGEVSPGPTLHEVLLSRQQYGELAAFVRGTVGQTDETGAAVLATDVSYSAYDRFYLSRGRYHLFNTCNQWTGRGLYRVGVPTGIWTPLVVHVRCQLPK